MSEFAMLAAALAFVATTAYAAPIAADQSLLDSLRAFHRASPALAFAPSHRLRVVQARPRPVRR